MRTGDTIWCDGCGVEILWAPVKSDQRFYCCQDCADGYECRCGARMEDDEYQRGRGENVSETSIGEGY